MTQGTIRQSRPPKRSDFNITARGKSLERLQADQTPGLKKQKATQLRRLWTTYGYRDVPTWTCKLLRDAS